MTVDQLPARLRRRVRVDSSGCWVWTGGDDGKQGYGRVSLGGRRMGAHRATYTLLVGPIAPGLTLDHLCRTPACVNPEHLEPVSHRDNCLRGTGPIPENASKDHCVHGHPFDEANTYIRPNGRRDCRTCIRERQRAYQARRAA